MDSKSGFFQKVQCVFQISKKMYSISPSWTWNLNFPPITVNNKFKFQAQDSNLEYFYFGDLKKTNRTFWKKDTFNTTCFLMEIMCAFQVCWFFTICEKANMFCPTPCRLQFAGVKPLINKLELILQQHSRFHVSSFPNLFQ